MAASLVAAIVGFSLLEYRFRVSSAGAARNRAFSRALIAAQEGERLRISYELHDAVAQDLATAKLYCGLCEEPYGKKASGMLDRAIEEIRNICHGLRPAELDRLGIVEAVSHLCNEMHRESGIEVKLTVEGLDNLALQPETEINLFRILQEALTNVRRHAQARHVRVVLFGFGDYVELTVDDDGRGPQGAQPGLGRTGMEEARAHGRRTFLFRLWPPGGGRFAAGHPAHHPQGGSMKTVYIVDDHGAIREGFKVILERTGRYNCVGEAGSAEEALGFVQSAASKPELFLVDISPARGQRPGPDRQPAPHPARLGGWWW